MSDVGERVVTDPRISRRRRAIARAKRRKWFTIAAAAAAVTTAAWAVLWSPLLHVRDIRVVGARHTTWQDVALAADIDGNENLLLLSTSEIAERAETLPWVRKAEVDRMLPGTVRVRIDERRPALVVKTDTGALLVDARGRVLDEGHGAKGLPVLSGGKTVAAEPGDTLASAELLAAVRAYRSLPARLARKVATIFAPTPERLTFSLADGTVVRYGAAERMADKNEVLRALLARIAGDVVRVAYIDVRVPTSPAVAPVAPPPPTATPTPPPEDTAGDSSGEDRARDGDLRDREGRRRGDGDTEKD